ncbi:hypothetical protein FGRMN_5393 [Fusarium graminum]|nr:hypothetical protein FGRMN_5393 [Fusarium graminum]
MMNLTRDEIDSLVIPIRCLRSLRTWEKVQDITAADVAHHMNSASFVRFPEKLFDYEVGMSNLLVARFLKHYETDTLWGIGGHSIKWDPDEAHREEQAMGLTYHDIEYLAYGFVVKCPCTASFPEAMRMLNEWAGDLASKGLLDAANDSDLEMLNKEDGPEHRDIAQESGPKFEGDDLIAF